MPKTPDAVDVLAGSRIRLRRNFVHMSQSTLAVHIGVTFQQIQKYEKGTNRVSASRIQQIARVLNVPVEYFFDEERTFHEGEQAQTSSQAMAIPVPLSREAIMLNRAFVQIADPGIRKLVIALVETVGSASDA